PVEADAQGGAVVVHHLQPFARRHFVRQSRPRQHAFGYAPQRRGDAGEQPEGGQRQRQADRDHAQHRLQPVPGGRGDGIARFVLGQLQQGGQRQHRAQQAQQQRQRSLVEQEGGERGEQG